MLAEKEIVATVLNMRLIYPKESGIDLSEINIISKFI